MFAYAFRTGHWLTFRWTPSEVNIADRSVKSQNVAVLFNVMRIPRLGLLDICYAVRFSIGFRRAVSTVMMQVMYYTVAAFLLIRVYAHRTRHHLKI